MSNGLNSSGGGNKEERLRKIASMFLYLLVMGRHRVLISIIIAAHSL